MRILFVCPVPPLAPTGGSTIQTYHFILRLSKRHQVGIWALSRPGPEAVHDAIPRASLAYYHAEPAPRSGAWRLRLRGLSGIDPMSRWGFDGARLAVSIEKAVSEFSPEVVVFDGLQTAFPAIAMAARRERPALLFNAHDAVHVILRRSALWGKAFWPRLWLENWFIYRVKLMEKAIAAAVDCALCVSEVDAAALELPRVSRRYHIAPNGVDADYFRLLKDPLEPSSLVFAGSLSYGPNFDAVRYYAGEIHPRLRGVRPDARLIIVGEAPPELDFLRETEGLEFAGFQSDVRPFFERSTVSVVPLRGGSGTRFKILESWAMGRPVVSTSIGAEGLPYADRVNLLIADTPEEFADRIAELLDDHGLRASLARSGRKLVEERFQWDKILEPLENVLEATAAGRKG